MESYKREFINFLKDAGVLKFGDFTAKSGRKIPYFINAGDIKTGEQIARLGEFYARAYSEHVGKTRRSSSTARRRRTTARAASLSDMSRRRARKSSSPRTL